MRDEIGRSQGASVADVMDPTSRRRNEAERVNFAASLWDTTLLRIRGEKAPGVASHMSSSTAC